MSVDGFLSETSKKGLETLKGIKFTPREIDVLACIPSGRGRKTIATLLSIGDKTVETHIHNIMRKLEVHSQENIREIIERSDKFIALKNHYMGLLKENSFKKALRKISSLSQNKRVGIISEEKKQDIPYSFLSFLIKSLERAGFKILGASTFPSLLEDLKKTREYPQESCMLYIAPGLFSSKISYDKASLILKIESLQGQARQEDRSLLFLLPSLFQEETLLLAKKMYVLTAGKQEDPYDFIFKILKEIIFHPSLKTIEEEFKKECNPLYEPSSSFYLEDRPILAGCLKKISNSHLFSFTKRYKILPLIFGGGLIIGTLSFYYLFSLQDKASVTERHSSCDARSDLILPNPSLLLNRAELLKEIDQKFNSQNAIQTVALVGIGGAGKTTLAHHYARQQSPNLLWEVNAATSDTLKESFENLAQALSITKEDQKKLTEITALKEASKKEEKLMDFIKKTLKKHSNWFLIFDNVEKFSDIQRYVPKDPYNWGRGKILITTRDSTIQNSKYVNAIIQVGMLTDDQKRDLFARIMVTPPEDKVPSFHDPMTKAFLSQLPPFPLDISLAAYYLKATNVSYTTYLENLKQYDEDFLKVQENLLKESGEYDKTRYSIIILSLQHLLNTSQDFKDLLLLISLLDSQDIPHDLLSRCKSESIAGNFLYNLEKYSLVTFNSLSSSKSLTLSLHRSLQLIILEYLTKTLRLDKTTPFIPGISGILENYIHGVIAKEDLPHIKLLIRHIGSFLTHDDLLTPLVKGVIESSLGRLYFYMGEYRKAVSLLEKNLPAVRKYYKESSLKVAQILDTLGVIYKELEEYTHAKEVMEEGLVLYQKYHPTAYNDIFKSLVHLGSLYKELGQLQKAKAFYKDSIPFYKKYIPHDNKEAIWALVHLGLSYKGLEQYEQAIEIFERCLTLYKTHFPHNALRQAWVLATLGNVYRLAGHNEKALNLLKASVNLYQKEAGDRTLNNACALGYLGETYQALGNYKEAFKTFKKSLSIYQAYHGKAHLTIARLLRNLGKVALAQNNFKEAKVYLQEATQMYEKQNYPEKREVLNEWRELQKNTAF